MSYFRFTRNEGYTVRGTLANVRIVVGALATLLGILALWILTGELTSPRLSYFPSSANEANTMYAVRRSAATAAEIGLVRGDLWAVAAITGATPLLFGATSGSSQQESQAEVDNVRVIADRAARLSPHDARIWLVLAGLDLRVDGNNSKGIEALKLSYYTGPNEISLMPLRLLLAVSSNAIFDEDVQSLVPMDLQVIILQRPDLKPAIVLAHQNALPKGREIIEAALRKTDPSLLKTIPVPHRGPIPD